MELTRLPGAGSVRTDESLLLGSGGEARVYALAEAPDLVAKVYHRPSEERAHKLQVMVDNPPTDPTAPQGHVSIAWPVELLGDPLRGNEIVGALIPRVHEMPAVMDYYSPGTRRRVCPLFSYLYLHRTARNIAVAVHAVHIRGYAIGDVNESNIRVAGNALVTLVDTDSFQVTDPLTRRVFRSHVGKPEFTPPELQGVHFSEVDRLAEHDLFGLGVVIFRLLMEGTHPFSGLYTGEGEPPSYEANIVAGHFPYGQRRTGPNHPVPTAPAFEIIDPELRALFLRCFEDGFEDPSARPDAETWHSALAAAEDRLTTCALNPQHRHGRHLGQCPWCARAALFGGLDPFPSRAELETSRPAVEVPAGTAAPPATPQPTPSSPPPAVPPRPPAAGQAQRAAQLPAPLGLLRAPALAIDRLWSALLGWEQVLAIIVVLLFTMSAFSHGQAAGVAALATLTVVVVLEAVFRDRCRRGLRLAATGTQVHAMAFSPTSARLAGTDATQVVQWELRNGRGVWLREGTDSPRVSLAFSPDGSTLAAGSMDGLIVLWQAESRAPLGNIPVPRGSAMALRFSPDGGLLAAGYTDGTVAVWDAATQEPVRSLSVTGHRVTSVAWTEGGMAVVSAGTLGKVVIWDFRREGRTFTVQGPAVGINALACSPDGYHVAGGGMDRVVYLWTAWETAAPRKLTGHTDPVYCLEYSADGRFLASGDLRGDVLVWHTKTGSRYHRLSGAGACVKALSFADDDRVLRVACSDGTVRFWTIR